MNQSDDRRVLFSIAQTLAPPPVAFSSKNEKILIPLAMPPKDSCNRSRTSDPRVKASTILELLSLKTSVASFIAVVAHAVWFPPLCGVPRKMTPFVDEMMEAARGFRRVFLYSLDFTRAFPHH